MRSSPILLELTISFVETCRIVVKGTGKSYERSVQVFHHYPQKYRDL